MTDSHLHSEFLVQMFGKMLCAINAAMLPASATKREHDIGESALNITEHMGIGKFIDTVEKFEYFAVIFKETDYRFVETSEIFIGLVTARIVGAATVKHITAAVSARVFGNSLMKRKTKHSDHKFSLAVVFGISGRAVFFVSRINICGGNAITIVALQFLGLLLLKLRQGANIAKHLVEIRIRTSPSLRRLRKLAMAGGILFMK